MKIFITIIAVGYVLFHIVCRLITGRKPKFFSKLLLVMFLVTLIGYSFRDITLPVLRGIFWYAQRILDVILGNVYIK